MKRKKLFMIVAVLIPLLVIILFFLRYRDVRSGELAITRIFKQISYSTENLLAKVIYPDEKITIPLKFKKQEHSVTCEVAALRMVLNYYGHSVTENELLENLRFDTKEAKTSDNVWGDPEKGFVGNIDGSIFLGTGYGVYEGPIHDLADEYREAEVIEKADLEKVLGEVVKGNPVIVWGLLSNRKPIKWKTKEGKEITAFPGEHARVVIGFVGVTTNPTHIIMMDPIYGKIHMKKSKFLADWKVLDNRAVVIY